MEETNYDRPQRPNVDVADATPALESTEIDDEKIAPTAHDILSGHDSEAGQIFAKKTYWQKLSIWPESRPNRLLQVMWGPIRFFSYPIVVYAGLMYGANGLVWSSVLNSTAGTLYPREYGFSTAGIALAYLGGTVGVIVGYVSTFLCNESVGNHVLIFLPSSALYCGKLGEVLVIRLARRNGGVAEAEHILWTFMASLTMVPFSLLLWGLGGTYGIHWFGMVFAQFTLAISNAIACPMALAYAISAYPEMSGEMVTTAVIIRNTMSFAINYA